MTRSGQGTGRYDSLSERPVQRAGMKSYRPVTSAPTLFSNPYSHTSQVIPLAAPAAAFCSLTQCHTPQRARISLLPTAPPPLAARCTAIFAAVGATLRSHYQSPTHSVSDPLASQARHVAPPSGAASGYTRASPLGGRPQGERRRPSQLGQRSQPHQPAWTPRCQRQ